ncbi:MAG: alpha/beta hydrolase family protein [Bacillota bacterium]
MAFIQCHFQSMVLDLNASVNVIIPEDIKENEKIKVLYLLHGYIGDHTDWTRLSSIERYVSAYRIAVVMPAVNNSYYTDMIHGLPYYTFMTQELPKFITSTFPVSTQTEDNYICGLSMGGYGAFKIALSPPYPYVKAASISGALDIEHIRALSKEKNRIIQFESVFGLKSTQNTTNDLKYLINLMKKNKVQSPQLFIGCGTEDFLHEDNVSFTHFLDQEKIQYTYKESIGNHDWSLWDEYIQIVLKWMFKA